MSITISKKYIFTVIMIFSMMIVLFSFKVFAASIADVAYPVAELGNCRNERECRAYCDQRDKPGVAKACVAFAKKYNLLPPEQIARAEKFIDTLATGGPGGCTTEQQCVTYCENIAHIEECVAFAGQHDVLSAADLAEAQKIAQALKAGAALPGGCTSKESCLAYCENPDHIDECLIFAEKSGLIDAAELADAKKFAPYIKRGETPGQCKRKEECERYCFLSEHLEECANFGLKVGIVTPEEAELIRKTHGKTPGNCRSREACEAFCSNPDNQKVCIDFAKENGLISPEEATYVDRMDDFQICLDETTPEIRACIVDALGADVVQKMSRGVLPMQLDLRERSKKAAACVAKSPSQDLRQLPSEMKQCLAAKLGDQIFTEIETGHVACRGIPPLKKAIDACVEETKASIDQKIDECLTLSCANVTKCIQRLSSTAQGETKNQKSNPKVEARINECVQEEINACMRKPCGEFFACISGLGEGDQKQSGEQKTNPALDAKIQSCTKAMQQGSAPQGESREQQTRPEATPSSSPPAYEQPSYKIDCSAFASATSCSYVGSPDSDNYKYCKQCYPER